jgi:RNA polymerase sigma factor (sigma-70 family)
MILQVQGVGKQKIEYKDHANIEFDSLHNYILLAKKAISKFGNQFYNGLSSKMLKDEDAIANIANSIMMADWRWDDNYTNSKGTKKTKYSYRNQCALWAIQTYVTKNHKFTSVKQNKNTVSLDFNIGSEDDSSTIESLTQDYKAESPLDILIKIEQQEDLVNTIDSLLSLDCISSRQKDYIRLYYFDGYTFEKIGKKYNITREAVRQGLNKAINIIKDSIHNA